MGVCTGDRGRRHDRSLMPRTGDPYAQAFIAELMQCWRMIHDRQGQAAHCMEAPTWTGRWFSPRGDRWWRVGRAQIISMA